MLNFPFDNTLKEEVRKLNLKDLKDVDDIFENKEIKLNIDYIYKDINYLKLKKAKIRAQLIMNHFYNYESFRNCEILKAKDLVVEDVDESIEGDIEYIFAAKPKKDDLIDALYDYAFWFLLTQQAEIHSYCRKIRKSIKCDMIMCCMCDSELSINESICSVCYEPTITTIQELMAKFSLDESRIFHSTGTEDHFVPERKFCGELDLDNLKIENENNFKYKSNISDVEMISRHDSMNSLILDNSTQSNLIGTRHDSNCTDNESSKGIYGEVGDQCHAQMSQYCRQSSSHENGNCKPLRDCSGESNSSKKTDIMSDQSIHSISIRDKNYYGSISKPHIDESIRNYNDPLSTTLISDIALDNNVRSKVDSDNKWKCETCGLLNDQSFLSCEACSAPKVAMWTCLYCNGDNKISTRRCETCDREMKGAVQRRFCTKCRENEVAVGNEICEDCIMIKWVCWWTICNGVNYGSVQFCNHCGIDKTADKRPGQPIKMLKDDKIYLIWICSECSSMNDDVSQDRCGKCQGPRDRTATLAMNVSNGMCDDSSSFQIIDSPHNNKQQLTPPSSQRLYPSLPFSEQKPLWTCRSCHVDNIMSNRQCIACEMSRFCKLCKVDEIVNENLCANCLAQKWQCWYKLCKNINVGTNTFYCEKCGLSKQHPNISGEPVYQANYDRTQLVWICDNCQKINANYQTYCSNYHCRTDRNTKFVWCRNCGWGTLSGIIDVLWGRKCKQCNMYLS